MIYFRNTIYEELIAYGKQHLPYECCGVLIGQNQQEDIFIEQFIPITNVAKNKRKQFMFCPKQWTTILLQYEHHEQHNIVGIFHSHPDEEPFPSSEDKKLMWRSIPTYWIASYRDKPILEGFHITEDQWFHPVSYKFI
ncbi:Mov34/MPN/PAD-1 family protein [Longirhabdus pacifica]|uniref:Mov34/MPN/PAD-1 family protein n=1 Tax=Longirhabdus pacifica TaxID=2305227 RepID=UPI001008C57D|nr:M67 family metallopeptidase [Longirhabdus pacifica]